MKVALLRLLSSMKFWTAVLGVLTALGAKYGLEVDPETYWTIVGFFSLLLGGQALQDHGKAKAEIETRHIQSGFARVHVMLVIVGLGLIVTANLPGCAWLKSESKAVAADAIDCTTEKAIELAKEYGPSVELALRSQLSDTGKIDRTSLKALAKSFATETGQCVLAREVVRLLTPRGQDAQSTPLPIDTEDVAAAWEEVRRDEFGGKTFVLEGS